MSLVSMGMTGLGAMDTDRLERVLSQMPGYGPLYGHMTAIMYSAGVQPGTQLEKDLIQAGKYLVLMQAADIMQKAGMKEVDVTGMTAMQRDTAMAKLYGGSNALIEIDAMVQKPEYADKLRKMIAEEVARRAPATPPKLPATTGDGSTAKKIAEEAGRSEAAVLPILETGTGTGKIWGMDSKTFLLVAAGLLLMMNSD